jgi:hypothetical protein
VQFLEKRCAGEVPVKLSSATGNARFGSRGFGEEWCWRDGFGKTNHYAGKIYKDRKGRIYASELVSMGMQWLFEKPSWFAATDPEFFDLIWDIVRYTRTGSFEVPLTATGAQAKAALAAKGTLRFP